MSDVYELSSPLQIASGNPDYLKIHLAGLRQMIGLRKNFADVPPDVRFQISWSVVFSDPRKIPLMAQQDGYSGRLHGTCQTYLHFCPIPPPSRLVSSPAH